MADLGDSIDLEIYKLFIDGNAEYFVRKFVEFHAALELKGYCIIKWEGGQDKIMKEEVEPYKSK